MVILEIPWVKESLQMQGHGFSALGDLFQFLYALPSTLFHTTSTLLLTYLPLSKIPTIESGSSLNVTHSLAQYALVLEGK